MRSKRYLNWVMQVVGLVGLGCASESSVRTDIDAGPAIVDDAGTFTRDASRDATDAQRMEPDSGPIPEALDLGEGLEADIPATFNPNHIVSDSFYNDTTLVTVADIQRVLEESPYGERSWLADYSVGDVSAAEAIVQASTDNGINPIMTLARMQVESSLVSRRPASQTRIDFALGCGCPDSTGCSDRYRGLDKQIACATQTMRRLYDRSVDGTAEWRMGLEGETHDHRLVTPHGHATAALYGYTPWVNENTAGNWLVWNVTRRVTIRLIELGILRASDLGSWIGSECDTDEDCAFTSEGYPGECFGFASGSATHGFCSLPCEGTCPDRPGTAPTFCVSLDEGASGQCVSKSSTLNSECDAIAGTRALSMPRYLGSSSSSAATATVCAP